MLGSVCRRSITMRPYAFISCSIFLFSRNTPNSKRYRSTPLAYKGKLTEQACQSCPAQTSGDTYSLDPLMSETKSRMVDLELMGVVGYLRGISR